MPPRIRGGTDEISQSDREIEATSSPALFFLVCGFPPAASVGLEHPHNLNLQVDCFPQLLAAVIRFFHNNPVGTIYNLSADILHLPHILKTEVLPAGYIFLSVMKTHPWHMAFESLGAARCDLAIAMKQAAVLILLLADTAVGSPPCVLRESRSAGAGRGGGGGCFLCPDIFTIFLVRPYYFFLPIVTKASERGKEPGFLPSMADRAIQLPRTYFCYLFYSTVLLRLDMIVFTSIKRLLIHMMERTTFWVLRPCANPTKQTQIPNV